MDTQIRCSVRTVLALAMCIAAAPTGAIEHYLEYRKQVETAQKLSTLKDDLFGEHVSLYNGKTEFANVDIDVPGNSALPVQLRRRFSVELDLVGSTSFNANIDGVGGWEVDVPSLSGTFPTSGWPDDRCTGTMVPGHPPIFQLTEIWQGNTVHIPGDGDRALLGVLPSTPVPADGVQRKWTTAQRDAVDCIPMKSGLTGEGFRLKTTKGVVYHFDTATSRLAGTMEKSTGEGHRARVGRVRRYLLASRVEDRFGNWVQYEYNSRGRPVRIWSNDGRDIVLVYDGEHLAYASSSGRTWRYQYGTVEEAVRLTEVVLPDNSKWTYSYSTALRVQVGQWDGHSRPDCREQPPEAAGELTLQIGHPSGATGTFNLKNLRHGRSGLHISECAQRIISDDAGTRIYYELRTPYYFDVMTLLSKTVTGPGLKTPLVWRYDYGNGLEKLWGSAGQPANYPCTTCKQQKTAVVTNPDGTSTHHIYGTQYALNEGRPLGTRVVSADGTAVQSRSSLYMSNEEAAAQAFAPVYGLILHGDDPSTAQVRPIVAEGIEQESTLYQRSLLEFDALARPTVTHHNGPGGDRSDRVQYHDDRVAWMLGQTASITNEDTGSVAERTVFDSLSRPIEEWAHERLVQRMAYHPDGMPASATDARGNATHLSAWKRGTPGLIRFADGASQSAVIDDNGWLKAVVNEIGAITRYEHDPLGRITRIRWSGDEDVEWTPSTLRFEQIHAEEHGIAAGHWRSTVVQGNSVHATYYDALWRPLLTEAYDAAAQTETQRWQRFDYDEAGRQIFASYLAASPSVSTGVWTSHDALGRARSVSNDSEQGVLTTTTEYLPEGRTRVTSPRGFSTLTTFMAFSEPTYDAPLRIEQPEGVVTEIARDVFGQPSSIVRRNLDGSTQLRRTYVQNRERQVCKIIEPETGATLFAYDAAGNVAWGAQGLDLPSTDACDGDSDQLQGKRILRTWDARNRLSTVRFPDGSGDQDWAYTADGLVERVVTRSARNDGLVTNTFAYNTRGLLVHETATDAAVGLQSLGYRYNALGALAGITYPSGAEVDYAPNALGQPTRAGTYVSGVLYHPGGGMKEFTYGNGIVHSMETNARQMPSRVMDSHGAIDVQYDYDVDGNPSAILDVRDASRTRTLSYDGRGRLVTAASRSFGGAGVFNYGYDALDNLRAARLDGGKHYDYDYDARNRLTNIRNQRGETIIGMDYDARGNLRRRNAVGYMFDSGNRLRGTERAEQYRYDAHGRRILSWQPETGAWVRSLYGNDGVLRRRDDWSTGASTEYITLNGSLVAEVTRVVVPLTPQLSLPDYSADGSYEATWSAPAGATRYQLREQIGGGAWNTVLDGADRRWAVTSRPTAVYGYEVRACSQGGCSPWSPTASVVVQLAPTGVASISLRSEAANGVYTVSWTAVAGATRYTLEERGGAFDPWWVVQSSADTAKAYSGKPAGRYDYRVQGCNLSGCGPWSPIATTVVLYPPAGPPTLAAIPKNLTGTFAVTWSEAPGATGYALEESVAGRPWAQVASGAIHQQTFHDKPSGGYAYRARGNNKAGWGPYSVPIDVVVIRPPAAPTISAPGYSGDGSYVIGWSAVPFAVSYEMHERRDGGPWSHVHSTVSTQAPRSGMGFGTYDYRVRSCNEAGCGAFSNVVQVRSVPTPRTPMIQKSLQTRWTCAGKVKIACQIEWNAELGASRYEVRSTPERIVYSGPNTSVSQAHSSIYCAPTHVIRACNETGCSADSAPFAQGLLDLGEVGIPRRVPAPGVVDSDQPGVEGRDAAAWPSCPAG